MKRRHRTITAAALVQLPLLRCDTEGSVAILWAIVLPVIFGFIALSLGVSILYLTRNELQTATDSAAVAASYSAHFNPADLALLTMTINGFDQRRSVKISVNNPPSQGGYAGTNDAVEVIATMPANKLFSTLTRTPMLRVRAVGLDGRLVE